MTTGAEAGGRSNLAQPVEGMPPSSVGSDLTKDLAASGYRIGVGRHSGLVLPAPVLQARLGQVTHRGD